MTTARIVGTLVLVGTTPEQALTVFPQVNSYLPIYKGFTALRPSDPHPSTNVPTYQHAQCWYSQALTFFRVSRRCIPAALASCFSLHEFSSNQGSYDRQKRI
jgi:hypothetical protein